MLNHITIMGRFVRDPELRRTGSGIAVASFTLAVGPHREFCVSDFRQNQEYHVFNVQDEGLFPLSKFLPVGWDGMRAGTA